MHLMAAVATAYRQAARGLVQVLGETAIPYACRSGQSRERESVEVGRARCRHAIPSTGAFSDYPVESKRYLYTGEALSR